MLDAVPDLRDPSAWRTLGQILRRHGYQADPVTRALSLPGWNADTLDTLYWEMSIGADEPLATLIRFFLHGHPVPLARRRYLPSVVRELGCFDATDAAIRATRSVVPLNHEDLVCSDVPRVAINEPGSVFLPDSSTLALRRVQPRAPVQRHLDLGSGGGAVALAASRWARVVHCVDINDRAGAIAQATFALSGRPAPRCWTGGVTDAVMIEPVDRLSFVLPLLVPWEGMGPAPVHTLAVDELLLEETLATLPMLLGPRGLALLFCQCWTPSASPAELLAEAFGDRAWRGGHWWEAEEESSDGPLRVGVLAVQADVPGGWSTARNTEADLPNTWWWPALTRDLGWR